MCLCGAGLCPGVWPLPLRKEGVRAVQKTYEETGQLPPPRPAVAMTMAVPGQGYMMMGVPGIHYIAQDAAATAAAAPAVTVAAPAVPAAAAAAPQGAAPAAGAVPAEGAAPAAAAAPVAAAGGAVERGAADSEQAAGKLPGQVCAMLLEVHVDAAATMWCIDSDVYRLSVS